MACYNCNNLNPDKSVKGKVDGALYYCKKLKTFVNPAKFECEKFEKSYRKSDVNDKIYKDGKDYYNDATPLWFYVFILIALIILGLIFGVFW